MQVSSPSTPMYAAFLRFRNYCSRAAMLGPCVVGFFIAERLRERVKRYV